ncbi:MAG: ABC transporter permease [Geminicoccales bacterium]
MSSSPATKTWFQRLMSTSPFWSLLFWAALWELSGQLGWMTLLPPLSGIWIAFLELLSQNAFWDAFAMTARTFLIGLGLSVGVGIPIGILMGLSKRADKLLSIWVNIFLSAPITAVIPALMPLLGIGDATVIATVILFAIWVVIIDTQAGVTRVSTSLVEMGRVFGCSKTQAIFWIVIPAALPEMVTGIRLAVVRAIKGVIVGQIVIALIGFGGLFSTYLSMFLMERFWALILVVFALAFTIIGFVEFLERRIAFYAKTR